MYEVALSFLNQLKLSGYQAYIVGGYPRDRYLGRITTDIDICTDALPSFFEENYSVVISHISYGAVTICYQGYLLEITTFRKDYYTDTRYPTVTYVKTLKEDLIRRDFIINTLCIDHDGNYVDLLGARKDIEQKMIRVVGEPDIKFEEDPIRMIRALRFAADLGFTIAPEVMTSMMKNRELLGQLSHSRVEREMDQIENMKDAINLIDKLAFTPYFQ